MKKGFKNNWGLGVILVVGVVLCAANYSPGTWLSGWDTLHPEFDFGLYFRRVIFSGWQEIQGLGAAASQAHAAELPRLLFYYPLSLILSAQFLRYSYFFLTLLLGPAGVYFFLKRVVLREKRGPVREVAAFGGGLFYLLNLGTLQNFYLPLEMFSTAYATIPWLFLFSTEFVRGGKKKALYLFSLTAFFAAPMAHTPTLFYVFTGLFVLYLVGLWLQTRGIWKKVLLLTSLLFLINSFWLLPNLYYVFAHGKDVADSKIHRMFSEKAFLTGKEFGTLSDAAVLRNFYFDWGEYDEFRGQFVNLFDNWGAHLGKDYVIGTGYALFGLAAVGAIGALRERSKVETALLPVLLAALLFVSNDNFLSGFLYSSLTKVLPLFREAMRFPFTKFSLLLMFTYAVFLGRALSLLAEAITSRFRLGGALSAGVVFVWLSFYMAPAFSGDLISPSMRVKFPPEYFQLFEFFRDQPEGERVAHFPVHTFWGWVYYDWGYEGAGFLWFGLRQPLLDREFDRWMPQNENYYWEVSRAVYSEDAGLLKSVLAKYRASWILVDENVVSPASNRETYYPQIEQIFGQMDGVRLVRQFGKIKVYRNDLSADRSKGVRLAENLPVVNGYEWGDYDRVYSEYGDYISLPSDGFFGGGLVAQQESNRQDKDSDHKAGQDDSKFKSNHNSLANLVNFQLTNQQAKATIAPDDITSNLPLSNSDVKGVITITPKKTWPALSSIFAKRTSSSAEKVIQTNNTIFYPFRTLFTGRGSDDFEYEISSRFKAQGSRDESEYFVFESKIPRELQGGELVFPAVDKEEIVSRVTQDPSEAETALPEVYLDGELIPLSVRRLGLSYIGGGEFSVRIPIRSGYYSYDSRNDANLWERIRSDGALTPEGRIKFEVEKDEEYISLSTLRTGKAYLLEVESRNISGRPLSLQVENMTEKRVDMQVFLHRGSKLGNEYLVLPPMQEDGAGYTLHFDNTQIGGEERVNELGRVRVQPIPYKFLTATKIVKGEGNSYFDKHMREKVRNGTLQVEHPNPGLYTVQIGNGAAGQSATPAGGLNNGTVVLNQSYDLGWGAYTLPNYQLSVINYATGLLPFVFGHKLDSHIRINNWANGWSLNNETMVQLNSGKVVIVFLPQYLQYLGFVLLGVAGLVVLKYSRGEQMLK